MENLTFVRLEKIEAIIGTQIYNFIGTLNAEQLQKMKKALENDVDLWHSQPEATRDDQVLRKRLLEKRLICHRLGE